MDIVPQKQKNVKKALYQINNTERAELLALADAALAQAQRFRAAWLAGGDPQSWQLWRACLADRETLLAQMGIRP
jgi:hypothetical protein